MKNTLVKIKKNNNLIIGVITKETKVSITVEIVYPYQHVQIELLPLLCGTYEQTSVKKHAKLVLQHCYNLAQTTEENSATIIKDYHALLGTLLSEPLSETSHQERYTSLIKPFLNQYYSDIQPIKGYRPTTTGNLLTLLSRHILCHGHRDHFSLKSKLYNTDESKAEYLESYQQMTTKQKHRLLAENLLAQRYNNYNGALYKEFFTTF